MMAQLRRNNRGLPFMICNFLASKNQQSIFFFPFSSSMIKGASLIKGGVLNGNFWGPQKGTPVSGTFSGPQFTDFLFSSIFRHY